MKWTTIFLLFLSILTSCGKSNKSGGQTLVTQEGVYANEPHIQQSLNNIGLELFFDKYDPRRGVVSGILCHQVNIFNSVKIIEIENILTQIRNSDSIVLAGQARSSRSVVFLLSKSKGFFKRLSTGANCPFKTIYL